MATTTIPILEKTVAVLEAISTAKDGASAKALMLSLNIPPASCYRILRTLSRHNWIREEGDGQYRLAFGLAALTRSYAETELLLRQLEFPLRALSDDTGLSVKISLREGDCAVTALRADSRRQNAITSPIGSKTHLALAGAAGAVLLAGLPRLEAEEILASAPKECWASYSREAFRQDVTQARVRGISRALGKFHPSIYALAVPLRLTKKNVAALAVVGWPDDFQGSRQAAMEKKLRAHAARMQPA